MRIEPPSPREVLASHSVPAFFLLALALGGGTVMLVVEGILLSQFALASAASASVAGVILTLVEGGMDGLKRMLRGLGQWRAGLGTWLVACLLPVPAILIGSLLNPLLGGDAPSFQGLKLGWGFVPLALVFLIVAGLGQELGWTGYLLPRLQSRFGALTSSAIRALLGSVWHLPLLLYARHQPLALSDMPYGGWIADKGFAVALGALLGFLLCWSIFYTWIYNHTQGSLLLVSVLHGSEVWVATIMLRAGIDPGDLDNYWGYGGILLLMAAVLVIATGPANLSRRHPRNIVKPSSPD